MREAFLFLAAFLVGSIPAVAATPPACTGGSSLGDFKLLVEPSKGGPPLPLDAVNILVKGDKLHYAPLHLPSGIAKKAKVAIVLVPVSGQRKAEIQVLPIHAADSPADWTVPFRVSVVGLVFAANGLNVKKVHALVERDPSLVPKLADYADRTSKIEALVQTLSKYEKSTPGGASLESVLSGFSSQYGVALPAIRSGTPPDQQAAQLLHAVLPAFSSNDPLAANPSLTAQSTGLAASVASLFLGSPVALATGGAALVENLRASLFPRTDFRSAFAQTGTSGNLTLCSSNEKPAPHTRLAYLWMLRVPDSEPPAVSLAHDSPLPLRWTSTIKVTCATNAQLKLLPRARDWQLVSAKTAEPVPVTVAVRSDGDLLALDLHKLALPPGAYHLAAKWDWTSLPVSGAIHLRPFADFANAKIASDSGDFLVAGNGDVPVRLTGADFEFVKSVSLLSEAQPTAQPVSLAFTVTDVQPDSGAHALEATMNTSATAPGAYLLRLEQRNGTSHTIPVTIHPPNPKLTHLPLRVNIGQPRQVIRLQGAGLDRIKRITSDGARWSLAGAHSPHDREATIRLSAKSKKGDRLAAHIYVDGLHRPLEIADALEVVGPRPKILSARKSFADAASVAFRVGEVPADSPVSFALDAANIGAHPVFHLDCGHASNLKRALTLTPGDKRENAALDFAGQDTLFLSLVPGDVGASGCLLMATVSEPRTGTSDAFPLGRVTLLPRIDKFTLRNERIGDDLYAGMLTGQNLQMIERTGWNSRSGKSVEAIPTPVPGSRDEQTLKIVMPWPPPAPQAPLYIWLRGEDAGRRTTATY